MEFRILNTGELFVNLLPVLGVDCVCDVGAMDASESLNFRRSVAAATLFAFEANPENYAQIMSNPEIQKQRITVIPAAVTNFDGSVDFFPVEADYQTHNYQRGMGSLHRRSGEVSSRPPVATKAVRLDTFLAEQSCGGLPIGLWIDVEGKAFEVLEGAKTIIGQICVIHVEVETEPCVAPDQKLEQDIVRLMKGNGFAVMATDGSPRQPQRNLLFVRNDLCSTALPRVLRAAGWSVVKRLGRKVLRR